MRPAPPRIVPFGDAALFVEWPATIDPATNRRVHRLAEVLRAEADGWSPPVPAYASLLAPFDPLELEPERAERRLAELLARLEDESAPPAEARDPLEIRVRYGAEDGPDLTDVARLTGLSEADVVLLHTSTVYRAYLLGFAPGFAYLGELPAELRLPRRSTPRQRVPAGSVAIAAAQTAVYPLATAGGWHLIGRTDQPLWDAAADPPALITPGRHVRFVAIG